MCFKTLYSIPVAVILCMWLLGTAAPDLVAQEPATTEYIYVPQQDWQAVVAKHPKGVQISYSQYKKMLSKHLQRTATPPVDAIVRKVEYHSAIEGTTLRMDIKMYLASLSDKLLAYRFSLGKLSIARAMLNGKQALLTQQVQEILQNYAQGHAGPRQQRENAVPQQQIFAQQQAMTLQQLNNDAPVASPRISYTVLLAGKGEHLLQLTCYQNLQVKRDELSVHLHLGTFPQQVFYLNSQEQMEYFTAPDYLEEDNRLVIYLGHKSKLYLRCRPREKQDVKQPVVTAQLHASHLLRIDSISSQFRVEFAVYHRAQKTFQMLLTDTVEIVHISEKRWQLEPVPDTKKQRLIVQLEKETLGKHVLTIHCEKQLLGDSNFLLPTIVATGKNLLRQEGVIYLEKTADIEAELTHTHKVRQLNPHSLFPKRKHYGKWSKRPATLLHSFGQEPYLAFKFWNEHNQILLNKKAVQAQVETTFVSAISLYADSLEMATHVTFDIMEGKVKQLELQLPKGWNLVGVEGFWSSVHNTEFRPLALPGYYVKKTVLYLPLPRKVVKGQRVKVSVIMRTIPDGWSDSWASSTLALPLIKPVAAKHLPSFVGVIADPDYALTLIEQQDIGSVDLNIIRSLEITSNNLRLGLKINSAEAKGTLKVSKKVPETSVVAAGYLAVEPEHLRCAMVLTFHIKNASCRTFQFFMPLAFKQQLQISDEFGWIKEKRHRIVDKRHSWQIKLQKRVINNYSLYLSYEVPLANVGNSYQIPQIDIEEISQLKGYFGIAGTSQAEIEITTTGLESIAIAQLPVFAHPEFPLGANFLHAYKYTTPNYRLTLGIRLHAKVAVASAVIEHAGISTLLLTPDLERVTCNYRLVHLGLQYLRFKLPSDANFWSAVVDGKGEKPLRVQDSISIPVPRHNDGRANEITVVYERTVPPLGNLGTIELQRPQINGAIPVKKLDWYVYFPRNYQVERRFRSPNFSDRPWYWQLLPQLGMAKQASFPTASGQTMAPTSPSLQYESVPNRIPRQLSKKSLQRRRMPKDIPLSKPGAARPKPRVPQQMAGRKSQVPPPQLMDPEEPMPEMPRELSEAEEGFAMADDESDVEKNNAPVEMEDISGSDGIVQEKLQPTFESKREEQVIDKDSVEWGTGTAQQVGDEYRHRQQLLKLGKLQTQTGIEATKAIGLRSLKLSLTTANTTPAHKKTSPLTKSIAIAYIRNSTARSLWLTLWTLSAIGGLVIFAQRHLPRFSIFLVAVLLFSYIPFWFGPWLTSYCNALVWGLFASVLLATAYKVCCRLGKWLYLNPLLILLPLLLAGLPVKSWAQEAETSSPVYIPYKLGAGEYLPKIDNVFIPYAHYVELWNSSYPERPLEKFTPETKPAFVLYHAHYQGKIVDSQVRFQVRLLVEITQAPLVVPIGLKDAAIEQAHLTSPQSKEVLRLSPDSNGYSVVLTEPGQYAIEVHFLPMAEVGSKQGHLQFGIVPIAASTIDFEIDSDLEVAMPNFSGNWLEQQGARKRISLFPGNSTQIRLNWYQSSERYRAQGLNITATSNHNLELSDNVLKLHSNIHYQVASGSCSKLRLQFPKDYTIINLQCTNLEQWILSPTPQYHEIVLRLLDSSQRHLHLEITAEKTVDSLPLSEAFPEVIPEQIARENGRLTLIYHNAYKVFVADSNNLRRISGNDVGEKFSETFRYTRHPYRLNFQIQWRKLHNFAYSLHPRERKPGMVMKINEEKILLDYRTQIVVKGAQIFAYQLLCPADYQIVAVQGKRVTTWRSESVAPKRQMLHIILSSSVRKREELRLRVRMEKERDADKPIAIPYLASPQVSYHTGTILVCSTVDLELTTGQIAGLEENDISAFGRQSGYVKRYAFRFEGEPYQGMLQVQSRRPQLEVDSVINLLVEDDWINWGYFLNYRIKFAGIDRFQFRLPADLGDKMEILGDNIREIGNYVAGKQQQYRVWTVILHNKVRGSYNLALFPKVQKNLGTGIVVPPIYVPKDVYQKLWILVQIKSQYELTAQKNAGLSSVTPGASIPLPPSTSASDFTLAYKMERLDWQLTFSEHKPQIVRSTHTTIDSVKILSTLDEKGECRHRIIYNIKHGGLQFLELADVNAKNIWGVFVAGLFTRPVKKQIEEQHLLIPLHPVQTQKSAQQQLAVRLIYSQRLPSPVTASRLQLQLPRVINIKEIAKIHWTVVLPDGYLYKFAGNVEQLTTPKVFREYSSNIQAVMTKPQLENLQAALSISNDLKVRQDRWWQQQQQSQQRLLTNINKSTISKYPESRLYKSGNLQQLGIRNLKDARRAGQGLRIYRDKKSSLLVGEAEEQFAQRQNDRAAKMMQTQGQRQRESLAFYRYDLETPGWGRHYHFFKKQGKAVLKIRCYVDPRESILWITIQFLGFLLLIIVAAHWHIFSGSYTLRKLLLTLLLIAAAICCSNFLDFVHYFYL